MSGVAVPAGRCLPGWATGQVTARHRSSMPRHGMMPKAGRSTGRGRVDGREQTALAHAARLISFERRLGIFREPEIQCMALARWLAVGTGSTP